MVFFGGKCHFFGGKILIFVQKFSIFHFFRNFFGFFENSKKKFFFSKTDFFFSSRSPSAALFFLREGPRMPCFYSTIFDHIAWSGALCPYIQVEDNGMYRIRFLGYGTRTPAEHMAQVEKTAANLSERGLLIQITRAYDLIENERRLHCIDIRVTSATGASRSASDLACA